MSPAPRRFPGGAGGWGVTVMFIFLLGDKMPTCLEDSTHFPWQPLPWHRMRPHLKKWDRHSQDSVAGGPERYPLSQERVNAVSEGGHPGISPVRFPVVKSGHLRLKVTCRVQGLCEDSEGQGSLVCCSPWGRNVLDTT